MSGFSQLWKKLAKSKRYREEFVAAQVKGGIPFQIRGLMKQKKLSQQELASQAGLTQGVVSRAADPEYGNLTLNTIIRIAAGFDVAFIGRFVSFSELGRWFVNLSEDIGVKTFNEENKEIQKANDIESAVTNLLVFPGRQEITEVGGPVTSGNATSTGAMSDVCLAGNNSSGMATGRILPQGQPSAHTTGSAWRS